MKNKLPIMIHMYDKNNSNIVILKGKIYKIRDYYADRSDMLDSSSLRVPVMTVSFNDLWVHFRSSSSSGLLNMNLFKHKHVRINPKKDRVILITPYPILKWSLYHKKCVQDLICKHGLDWESISEIIDNRMSSRICKRVLKYTEDFLQLSKINVIKEMNPSGFSLGR